MTPKSLALFTWGTVLLPNTKYAGCIILCLPNYNTLHFLYDLLSCHLSDHCCRSFDIILQITVIKWIVQDRVKRRV